MLLDVPPDRLDTLAPTLSAALERGRIVHFPECPLPLPSPEDQSFLRDELGRHLGRKNVSWYPDGNRLVGVDAGGPIRERARTILKRHAAEVDRLLGRLMPRFMRGARRGTSSFRPVQERGRQLSSHASNELVHVDAGAYGATHGDRILRFFVNLNPTEDRVWASRGSFAELFRRHAAEAGITASPLALKPHVMERAWSGLLQGLTGTFPAARLIDTSPYDRLMRRFHNFMKDSRTFRDSTQGRQTFSFRPYSAWVVLTDTVSHACLSGQHALVDTLVVPLANCTELDEAPMYVLAGSAPSRSRAAA